MLPQQLQTTFAMEYFAIKFLGSSSVGSGGGLVWGFSVCLDFFLFHFHNTCVRHSNPCIAVSKTC